MKITTALTGGLTGALVLTGIHETMRHLQKNAPRMDLMGEESLAKGLKATNLQVPNKEQLYVWTLLGDIIGNALFYSLTGLGGEKNALSKGSLLGIAAGVGGVVLPKYLGLDNKRSARTNQTKAMTVAWYLIGGLAAGTALKLLGKNR